MCEEGRDQDESSPSSSMPWMSSHCSSKSTLHPFPPALSASGRLTGKDHTSALLPLLLPAEFSHQRTMVTEYKLVGVWREVI